MSFTSKKTTQLTLYQVVGKKNGLCAWPIKNSNIKKIVQKKVQPNKKDFKWHIARKLGSCYGK